MIYEDELPTSLAERATMMEQLMTARAASLSTRQGQLRHFWWKHWPPKEDDAALSALDDHDKVYRLTSC